MSNRNFVQNFNDVHFEEEINKYQSFGDFKDNYNTKEETKVIFFNTKDINYLSGDNCFNFSIYFSPGNSDSSSINTTFKNVKSINFLNLVIRDAYVNLDEVNYLYNTQTLSLSNGIRLERVSDLPYLILEITDINNINYGTNNNINKSSFILKYDDDKDIRNNSGTYISYQLYDNLEYQNINNSIIPETNNKMLYYSCFSETNMSFYPTTKGVLKNMKITLKTPQGNILEKMNNFLTITSIVKNLNMIKINFDEYFSPEEYTLGDKLIFKDFKVLGNLQRKTDLETFLNNDGHLIIKNSDLLTATKMCKSIFIPLKNLLIKNGNIINASDTYEEDDFGIPNANNTKCSGTVINSSQQLFLGLEINCEKRDNNLLHGNII